MTIPAAILPDVEIVRADSVGLTYADLQQRVVATVAGLWARGVGQGDRVAVLDTATPATIQVLFACAVVGAVFVPLNYRSRLNELAHAFTASRPRLVIAGEAYVDLATQALEQAGIDSQFVSVAELMAAHEPDEGRWLEPVETRDDALAALLFTSGTTAAAKAVMLAHTDLVNYVFVVAELATEETEDAILIAAPLHHIAGLSGVLTSIWAGRRIVLMRQFDPAEWLRLVETERVTHAFLVPTMLKHILDDPGFAAADLSSLQVLSYGAAPMLLPVIRRAISMLPETVQLVNGFGQTETASTVTMLGPEDHRLSGDPVEDEKRLRRLASIGRPLPDVTVVIVDDDGAPLPTGQVGEITIASNRVMRGYYGQPEATQATLQEGWLRTRDLGWIDEDGYVFLAGRKSDMIIRGGENIAPEEIEIVLTSHPLVEEAAAFGEPDEEWGEIVVAAVVCSAPPADLERELIELCREQLGRYKTPQRIALVDALPRNDLGKLLRQDLRARVATGVSQVVTGV